MTGQANSGTQPQRNLPQNRGRVRRAKMSLMSAPKHRSKSRPPHHTPAAHKPVGRRVVKVGTREIITEGIVRPLFHDLFHHFMTVSWPRLFTTLAAFFLVFDLLFGFLYYLSPECVPNLSPPGFAGPKWYRREHGSDIDGSGRIFQRRYTMELNLPRHPRRSSGRHHSR